MESGYLSHFSDRLPVGWPKFSFLQGSNIYLLYIIQISYGAHPVSYSIGASGTFPKSKVAACKADHSAPSSVEVHSDRTLPPPHHTNSLRKFLESDNVFKVKNTLLDISMSGVGSIHDMTSE